MTFRLRIFLLVMLVAVTAIGATAWLTLNLTSRELARSEEALERHQREISHAVDLFGVLHGRWTGVDLLVADLSDRTGLHIQIQTTDGTRLADSDNLRGLAAGPVQSVPAMVSAVPALTGPAVEPTPTVKARPGSASGGARTGAAAPGLLGDPSRGLTVSPPRPGLYAAVLEDLFGDDPEPAREARPARVLRQVAQYRAALVTVRCIAEADPAQSDAIATPTAPYLSAAQIDGHPQCVERAVDRVRSDRGWLDYVWETIAQCAPELARLRAESCADLGFGEAAASASGISPVEIYLGPQTGEQNLHDLGRPAMFGAAGLVVVALLGTAWIARRVSHPVHRLTMASFLLASGNLDVRVPASGRGELAQLSASFNAMAEAVQRSEERQRRLVADVAHELRTPLSNLRGYLEGLSDGVVQPSRELFASLHEEALLQSRILDDLQVLALAENGDLGYARAPLDLADLAEATVTAHRAVAADREIALTVDTLEQVWVSADPDRIRQVLGNLLSNAIRYTDAGGHVLVRVRAAGNEATLTVRDTGMGMTAQEASRVFDRFWRADPARQRATGGTGLGLTIAHRIVTDHGGRIGVTSEPGKGTVFTVALPRTDHGEPPPRPPGNTPA